MRTKLMLNGVNTAPKPRHWGQVAVGLTAFLCLALVPVDLALAWRDEASATSFDYYVLTLSWSPQHCATRGAADVQQCGVQRRYGFVVHGLWPQFERGYPQSCRGSRRLAAQTVDAMLDIMPSQQLVRHEWAKHGTCSGMSSADYFRTVRRAFEAVHIPSAYKDPSAARQTSVDAIRSEFRAANPELDEQEVAVVCSGRFLQEVRVCFDKDLRMRRCGRDVRDQCPRQPIIVRPVR